MNTKPPDLFLPSIYSKSSVVTTLAETSLLAEFYYCFFSCLNVLEDCFSFRDYLSWMFSLPRLGFVDLPLALEGILEEVLCDDSSIRGGSK